MYILTAQFLKRKCIFKSSSIVEKLFRNTVSTRSAMNCTLSQQNPFMKQYIIVVV